MSKEVYLSNLEWTKTHDNIGGVMGNVVFKDNISYEEYEKLFDTVYYILTKKDEIETLTKRNKEIYEGFMATTQELCESTKEIERLNKKLEEYKKDFKEANDLALKLITNNQEYVRKSIKDTIDILIEKLQQKENIIKEVREYCMKYENWEDDCVNDIMKILDKENK